MDKLDDENEQHEKYCECLDCTHFVSSASCYGWKMNELNEWNLTEEQKYKLLKLIARISERSYRRGAQQGIVLSQSNLILPEIMDFLCNWRYENDLDTSPGLRGDLWSSLDVLQREENLYQIGFPYK